MVPPALHEALSRLGSSKHLTSELARDAVAAILADDCDPAVVAAFLTALHCRGIDSEILGGAAQAVQARMVPFPVDDALRPILDTCGTGGDGANSVNISTASAIVVAACGVRVAKHGNRSATGNSGSAEVLAELGVKYDAEPPVLRQCLERLGITFLFAPRFHPALKTVAPIRRMLPFRTLFNLIGPLVNPARPDAQVIGVPDRERARLVRGVLRSDWAFTELGRRWSEKLVPVLDAGKPSRPGLGYVLCGSNGLDEVSLSGTTHVFPVHGEDGSEQVWQPTDFGLATARDSELMVTGPADSALKIKAMFGGMRGPVRDVVLANAAAALKLVGKVDALSEGVALAATAIDGGEAARLLGRWAALSHS